MGIKMKGKIGEMEYDRLRNEIRRLCMGDLNKYSTAFGHFKLVAHYSELLTDKLDADKEIVMPSAWLHDMGSIIGSYKDHHIVGAEMAEGVLQSLDYPIDKIEQIKHCIYAHRGSKDIPRETIEAKIIASADAMSHFADISGLFHLVFIVNGETDHDKGKEFVKNKLKRSFDKIEFKEGYEIIMNKIKAAEEIFR